MRHQYGWSLVAAALLATAATSATGAKLKITPHGEQPTSAGTTQTPHPNTQPSPLKFDLVCNVHDIHNPDKKERLHLVINLESKKYNPWHWSTVPDEPIMDISVLDNVIGLNPKEGLLEYLDRQTGIYYIAFPSAPQMDQTGPCEKIPYRSALPLAF